MSDSVSGQVRVSQSQGDGIAVVTIDQVKRRNAMSWDMREAMMDVLKALIADSACRVIVLTGAEGHFCSGADVGGMSERLPTLLERRQRNGIHTHPITRMLFGGPKPVVAAVEGIAFGMGLSLATATDYIVAGGTARFCAAQIRVGLTPDVGLMWTLSQRVGPGKARELLLMAREFDAKAALAWGVINEIVEPGKALESAMNIARHFLTIPPVALALVRNALANGNGSLEESLKSEMDIQPILSTTRDHAEAVKAFMEKRKPVFVAD